MIFNRKMTRKILLILCIAFSAGGAIADSKSYGPIIHRQSKQIQELKDRISGLENLIKDLQEDLIQSGIVTKQFSANLEGAGSKDFIQPATLPARKNFFTDKENSSQPKDRSDYDYALAALKDSKYLDAEGQFASFIRNYPTHRLQSNATFWYAETFYRRGLFSKAAINYLRSYKKYPKGAKAPDALLKLAYSLASLNKGKEACSMLKKLDLEFPKRPIGSIKRTMEAKTKFLCN
ncbi:MAG: tol-pal system protein YbgF [Rickettsiales bacterium]|nr:MAG: tol-pal system protein YbgF [Rickettsiales bacterium]